jgi:hypothetical protein
MREWLKRGDDCLRRRGVGMGIEMQAVLQKTVKTILMRKDNLYALQLIAGEGVTGKDHRIENWIQVELAKELNKKFKVEIEDSNTNLDIVLKSNLAVRWSKGIALKVAGSGKDLADDIDDLEKSIKRGHIDDGFFIILWLLKDKLTKKSWINAFKSREPIKALIGNREDENIDPIFIELGWKRLVIWCKYFGDKNTGERLIIKK